MNLIKIVKNKSWESERNLVFLLRIKIKFMIPIKIKKFAKFASSCDKFNIEEDHDQTAEIREIYEIVSPPGNLNKCQSMTVRR